MLWAQQEWDEEIIEGRDLKRVREREHAAIESLELERLRLITRKRPT